MQLVERQKDVSSGDVVSVVIVCRNPGRLLMETIASVRRQIHSPVEIVVVHEGIPAPKARGVVQEASNRADRYIEHASGGRAAALNEGFSASCGLYYIPLSEGDLLAPGYVSECLQALRRHPAAAYAYTDYRLLRRPWSVTRKVNDYNFYELLHYDCVPATALVKREAWSSAGGYSDSIPEGHQAWEFWIRLGERECFGHHVNRALLSTRSEQYLPRKAGEQGLSTIRVHHPELYSYDALSRVKLRWSPAVSISGADASAQTISDYETVAGSDPDDLRKSSRAPALLLARGVELDPHAAEFAALAVWSGRAHLELPDGSLAVSRQSLPGLRDILRLGRARKRPAIQTSATQTLDAPRPLRILHKHLVNAELLSAEAWLKHPLRSLARLIPLRIKETLNRAARRPVFDLRFYLQFQPNVLVTHHGVIDRLDYMPKIGTRRRVAFVTPHLGSGGAETVLLDIANSLDRQQYEISVIATHSPDNRWLDRWQRTSDHIYDLLGLVTPERVPLAILSVLHNWQHEYVLLQNSLPAYSILPELRRILPHLNIMDLVHSVDDRWDLVSRTREVSHLIDKRIVISGLGQAALRRLGVEEHKIQLIRNGVDLVRFQSLTVPLSPVPRILYAARLDPVKRPSLVVNVALALREQRGKDDFRFVIAGDGAERKMLEHRVERAGAKPLFEFLGEVPDLAPVLSTSHLLIVTSENEGLPLVVLEALASGKPVVASNVGAIHEAVADGRSGYLINKNGSEVSAFAASLSRLLDDDQLRRRMGAAGRETMEAEYDRGRSRQAYRSLFQ